MAEDRGRYFRAGATLLVVSSVWGALHCGPELPPAPPPPPLPEAAASAAPASPKVATETPEPLPVARASASAFSPAPLVIAKGCLAREAVDRDVQARMREAWIAAGLFEPGATELPEEGRRKLSTRPLADLDGDGTEELTLADEGTGNHNQLTFLYVSGGGCWRFSYVGMAAAFSVPKTTSGRPGMRDLVVVQKASSCNEPSDRDGYTVTRLRDGKAGWAKARTTRCPCAAPKGKPDADCAFELP